MTNLLGFSKGTKEVYKLRFEYGNYQEFSIDEFCNISSSGDYGTYSYMYWSPSGIGSKSFKKFLIGLNKHYILCKMAVEDSFDSEDYIKYCKETIIEDRRCDSCSKKAAREIWDWLKELELEGYGESDLNHVQHLVYDNFPIDDYDVLESVFMPSPSYSRKVINFYKIAFKAFQEILEKELEEVKK